ncbi:Spy/CpxP family protein refolding chaperone [Terrarubrum flagellatum]|uniref:Spy/CpxP family protein refolding chaperone n=1 Tax=Terrirubrum flagellatum TaxID=2895980 RepID=UPI003144E57D
MTSEINPAPAPSPNRSRLRTVAFAAGLLLVGGVVGAGVVQAQMGSDDWRGPRWGDQGGWRDFGPRGWGGGPMGPMGPRMGGNPRLERFARFCGADTARFHPVVRAYAKADLRLTDAQAKEFDTLADQVLPALEDVKREACTNFSQMSDKAPEKLAQLSSVLRKAADATDKAVEPARKFYASLDPTQQARVDELAARRGGPRWR